MRRSSYGWCRQQFDFLRRQFLQADDLPLSDVLSEEIVAGALEKIGVSWRDRFYPPLVTLWVFRGQALSADQSCRAAVARLIAHRVSQGQEPCSAETGAYCLARKRLPEEFFSEVARQTGRTLDADADPQWLWKGGVSTCSMVRRFRCRIRPRIRRPILNRRLSDPASDSPWLASQQSFLSPAVPSWNWASAATPTKDNASRECSVPCGRCFDPAMCC